jgi:uncharacterized repeat protein (TIGR01451 family)
MKKLLIPIFLLITFYSSAQIVNIPDPAFKGFLVYYGYNGPHPLDANHDGEIQISEALDVDSLTMFFDPTVVDVTGIEAFTNLNYLELTTPSVTTYDFTGLNQLAYLSIYTADSLSSLILNGCDNLQTLFIHGARLITSLDLSGKANLRILDLMDVGLSSLNVQGCTGLFAVNFGHLPIRKIDVSNLPNLNYYLSYSSNLDSLDISNCPNLHKLLPYDLWNCSYFNFTGSTAIDTMWLPQMVGITSLDLSSLVNLSYLVGELAGFGSVVHLNLKNGRNTTLDPLFGSTSSALQYICADDFEVTYLLNLFANNASPVNVNSYCSFLPGGHYNTIQGTVTADLNNNGCDAGDPGIVNLPVQVDDNYGNSFFVNTHSTGDYSLFTNSGTFTVTPVFSNTYFTISPVSGNVLFDTLNSLIDTVDFCVNPNGVYNDLEVTLIPIGGARPGFPVDYYLSYKNYGTTTLSGNVQLNFDNSKMAFDNAYPSPDAQTTGQLSWNFSNIAPFQSGGAYLTLTLLPPPANNPGDTLSLLAVVNPITGDGTPGNNSFTLLQEVRSSFDPNDKECLEGAKLQIADIGKDLHYVVRFQNLGNDTAFNIVVADTLSDKLDWSTVEFINSSHPCLIKQTNNKLEFYFQDINLPWAAANELASRGYVAFKVKTKSTLVIGDSINNKASIYFDFNLPVVTNTAITIVSPTSQVPVKLEYFSVGKKNETNLLTWKAPSTHGTTGFDIERSADGIHFNKIGNITAGTQRCQLPFDFTDNKPVAGKNYYRLKITDADGISFYSKTLVIGNNKEDLEILAISNGPGNTIVYFNSTKQQTVQLKILAADGRIIYKSSSVIAAGNGQLDLGLRNLSHGIYSLMVNTSEGSAINKRFVK